MHKIAYFQDMSAVYPSIAPFNPSEKFPEYPWGEPFLAPARNDVYRMIREVFLLQGLDRGNFDKPSWNPLAEIIKPGETVLIKPNMVRDIHGRGSGQDIFSVVTHPSVVRALIDYVVIALKGKGKIIIGDAPIQNCNFENIVKLGYSEIISYYQKQGVDIQLLDLRAQKSKKENGVIQPLSRLKDVSSLYVAIDLKDDSMLRDISECYLKYRVANYNPEDMKRHHGKIKNEYLIPKAVLESDTIITVPKIKTHSKVGVTAALKGFVGINGRSDWLPHQRKGCKQRGSDEYLCPSFLKAMQTSLQELADAYAWRGKIRWAKFIKRLQKPVIFLSRRFDRDGYSEGNWWGNDTIWRTVCDLNCIVRFATSDGFMSQTAQRKVFVLGDMITAGEGQGPLSPTPKRVGILICGRNPLHFDIAVATIMGFDFRKLSLLKNSQKLKKYPISNDPYGEITIASNTSLNGMKASEINYGSSEKFEPSKGWVGHIKLVD